MAHGGRAEEREKQNARSATNLELRPFVLRSVCRDQSDAEVEVVLGRKKRDRLSRSPDRRTRRQ